MMEGDGNQEDSESESSYGGYIWNRPPRNRPWTPGVGYNLILAREENGSNAKELVQMLEDEEKKGEEKIDPEQLFHQMNKVRVEDAVNDVDRAYLNLMDTSIIEQGRGKRPVLIWRNPQHPCRPSADLISQFKIQKTPVPKPDTESELIRVLGVNYSGSDINSLIWQAENIFTNGNVADTDYHHHTNDQWGTQLFLKATCGNRTSHILESVGFSGTYGDEGDRLRTISYTGIDVYLLCFPINSQNYFDSIARKFSIEVISHSQHQPPLLILVGLASEKRDATTTTPHPPLEYKKGFVTIEEGIMLAKRIGAVSYVECSASTGHGVRELFEEVALVWYSDLNNTKNKKHTKGRCLVQ